MDTAFTKTQYQLQSVNTKEIFEDKNWLLNPPNEAKPSFLRAIYQNKKFKIENNLPGLYKFANWLPIGRILKGSSAPVTYKSTAFAKELGLKNLWITFSGYWQEKGATMETCTFKETEAYAVCSRMNSENKGTLVVASAGNTARAFAKVCSENNIPLLLCVPEDNIDALFFSKPINDCVRLIVTRSGSDYFDAIHLSNIIAGIDGFFAEGGAKNVARRDGMGTTVLSAVEEIGKIPDYYFQAIGSGTGAIAAWEANFRFLEDGRFGNNKMQLMLSQNIPFTPIYDAWEAQKKQVVIVDHEQAREQANAICAKVLSNRKPPYGIVGGLYDALKDTNGKVLLATNEEAHRAAKLFEQLEGIDIHPAAAIAVATLIDAAQKNMIDKDATIMLNITGGGEKRFKQEYSIHHLQPTLVFDIDESEDKIAEKVKHLFD